MNNINESVGIEHELVIVGNYNNKYSIFSAYNEGVKRAKYPYLCFMHDDIFYHTQNWGEKVISHFRNDIVGLIGVIGTHYFFSGPFPWWQADITSGIYIRNSIDRNEIETIKYLDFMNNVSSIEVVAVDGFWFCINKRLFSLISFDEQTFSGFHCYDTDICFQVREHNYQVRVVSDIIIEHFSDGNADLKWAENCILLWKKWKKQLPQSAGVVISENIKKNKEIELMEYLSNMILDYYRNKEALSKLQKSWAYLLGKLLLRPLKIFKVLSY